MQPLRVLFVCVGNSCRSQMAEGFARAYGSDVLIAHSAGTFPAASVSRGTLAVMKEWNIDIARQYPKGINVPPEGPYDIVVNMSGHPLPSGLGRRMLEWQVADPIGENEDFYRRVAGQIENLVMNLILELRSSPQTASQAPARKSNSRLNRGG